MERKYLKLIGALLLLFFCITGGFPQTEPAAPVWLSEIGPICRGNVGTDKIIALSFETLPDDQETGELLALLARYDIRATFFLKGEWAAAYPEQARKITESGHEIGNHSQHHSLTLCERSYTEMLQELKEANDTLLACTGELPTLFRPPYGNWNDTLLEAARQLNLETVLWDIDSLDWQNESPRAMKTRIMREAGPGSILRFQDAARSTIAGVNQTIESLLGAGFQITTVSDLLNYRIGKSASQTHQTAE